MSRFFFILVLRTYKGLALLHLQSTIIRIVPSLYRSSELTKSFVQYFVLCSDILTFVLHHIWSWSILIWIVSLLLTMCFQKTKLDTNLNSKIFCPIICPLCSILSHLVSASPYLESESFCPPAPPPSTIRLVRGVEAIKTATPIYKSHQNAALCVDSPRKLRRNMESKVPNKVPDSPFRSLAFP